MIEFVVKRDNLETVGARLGAAYPERIDLRPLVPEIARILDDENRRARLAALDINDAILVDVKDPLDPRRGGNGPPLAPRYEGSRVIANHFVRELPAEKGELEIEAGWSGIPFLAAHAAGGGHLPVRDIIGTTLEVDQLIEDVFEEYVDLRLEENMDGWMAFLD